MLVVDIFKAGREAEPGLFEQPRQPPVPAVHPLLINQQAETVLESRAQQVSLLELGEKGFRHSLEPKGPKAFNSWLDQHGVFPPSEAK